MTDKDEQNPEDEFRDMLRDFLSGNGGVDPSKLAGAAGLPLDAAGLQAMMSQLQNAMNASAAGDGKINWSLSMEQAKAHAQALQRGTYKFCQRCGSMARLSDRFCAKCGIRV